MTPPKRILIVRLSALGDVVMASGLIRALAERHPQAEISWLVEAPAAPLLRHNPRLKQVLIWPRAEWQALWRARQWGALWRQVMTFRRELRMQRFDWVLDAQGLLKSGLCAWMTGAPRRLGLLSREGSERLMTEVIRPPNGVDRRIAAEYRFAAEYLGAPKDSYRMDLAIGEAPAHTAAGAFEALPENRPVVALCPFTTRPQKHWFEDRWVGLAEALLAHGMAPVIMGGPADREAGARMAKACAGLHNLAGTLRLDESAAFIARCSLLVGVDTGLTHMGTALSVPTVALFGSTRPYLSAGTHTTTVMYDDLPCSPCKRHPTCRGQHDCMRQFTVDRVLAQALKQWRDHTHVA